MGGAFGQFTIRKEHLAHTKQPKTFTAWFLMLSNGWGKVICMIAEKRIFGFGVGVFIPLYTRIRIHTRIFEAYISL
jgi:hypothetical protein